MRQLYQDLLAARRAWPALADFDARRAELLPTEEAGGIVRLIRGGREPQPGRTLTAFFNLTAAQEPIDLDIQPGDAALFSSESHVYLGARADTRHIDRLLPHECLVIGPADWQRF
jgi:hypothetical protein